MLEPKKNFMLELELTYLAKYLPENIKNCRNEKIIDIYIPESDNHPNLRIRKKGNEYEITRKSPVEDNDFSRQNEETIELSEPEFEAFRNVKGKMKEKVRYYYDYQGVMAEIGIFQGKLAGLVLVDVEFKNEKDKNAFAMPNFCLTDVTQEKFLAGGMLAGKSYGEIENDLERFNYSKIFLN
jgi:CYTH domain-containing protein